MTPEQIAAERAVISDVVLHLAGFAAVVEAMCWAVRQFRRSA